VAKKNLGKRKIEDVKDEDILEDEDNEESDAGRLTKQWFIKELSDRSGYYQQDVADVWYHVEEMFKDIIFFEKNLVLPGLFKISVTTIPEHEGYNAVLNEPMTIQESKRINIKASRALLKMFDKKE
jgi:nucleoid DNA-binding protein